MLTFSLLYDSICFVITYLGALQNLRIDLRKEELAYEKGQQRAFHLKSGVPALA